MTENRDAATTLREASLRRLIADCEDIESRLVGFRDSWGDVPLWDDEDAAHIGAIASALTQLRGTVLFCLRRVERGR